MMWGRLIRGITVVLMAVAVIFLVFGSGIGAPELAIITVVAVAGIAIAIRRARPSQSAR